jgi:hypothetical protein
MPTINSFPIQTKRRADLDPMLGADVATDDVSLIYDASISVWKTISKSEEAYYNGLFFNTVAQSALASLPVGAKFSTKGCLSIGDGGHGDFIVSATALTTEDGYSCYELASGNFGNLIIDGKNIPEQFGARNDGVTDDGDALRRFIARVGFLRLKAGSGYCYSGSIELSKSGTGIVGEGSALAKLIPLDGASPYIVAARAAGPLRGFVMNGFTVVAPSVSTQDSIVMDGVRNFLVNDIVIDRGLRGLVIKGCSQGNFDNITIMYENDNGGNITARRYIYIEETTNANIGSKHPGDLFFSNINGRCGAIPYCYSGLEIHAADGIWFSNYHFGNCTYANVHINADRVTKCTGMKFGNGWHDIGSGYGTVIEGSTPSIVGHYQFNSVRCLGGDTGYSGYLINGKARDIKIGGDESSISGYQRSAIETLEGFTGDLIVNDTDMYDVSLAGSGLYDAVVDRSTTGSIRLNGGSIEGSLHRWAINVQQPKSTLDIFNVRITAGTSGRINYTPTSGNRIRQCPGFNPVGTLSVTLGASPWTYTNNQGYPVTMYVGGGTVSGISVDSQSTGLTGGSFTIAEGGAVTVTYSAAPTVRLRGC